MPDRIEQIRGLERFAQACGERVPIGFGTLEVGGAGRGGHDSRVPQSGAAPDRVRRIESVRARHAQIHQDQIRSAPARRCHRLLPVRSQQHLEADRLEHLPQQLTVLRLIVDREHARRRPS